MFVLRSTSNALSGRLLAAVGLVISLGLSQPAEAKRSGTFSGTASIGKGGVLRIQSLYGNIVIRSGPENLIRVRAEIHDITDRGGQAGRYTPAEIIAYLERKPPIVQKEEGVVVGSMLDDDFYLGVEIHYEITAPEWVALEIDATYGNLEVHRVGENIELEKQSGSVRIQEPRGKLTATIQDGNLLVLGAPREKWSLKSAAGGLEVVVPEGTGFELDAKSSEGRIDSEVPLGEHKPGRFEGAIHGGGPRIHLRSESGTVAIRQQ